MVTEYVKLRNGKVIPRKNLLQGGQGQGQQPIEYEVVSEIDMLHTFMEFGGLQ
jgi:hypothetical protein